MAWERVKGNIGGRSAGVDGMTSRRTGSVGGELALLNDIRELLRARTFRPLPVRER